MRLHGPGLAELQAYGLEAAADRKAISPQDWADQANKWRELGMYASFTLSGWESPADVSNREYMTLLRPAKKLVRQARSKLWPLQAGPFMSAHPLVLAPHRQVPSKSAQQPHAAVEGRSRGVDDDDAE